MSDLEVILNRINKLQAERELENRDNLSSKDKWREKGFDSGLEWVENEIKSLMQDKK